MRCLAVHVVPLWQEADGTRIFGMSERTDHPPVVGWCVIEEIVIHGEARLFVLTLDADA